jgi:predicted acylesterase/phospholipase RssA
MINEYVIKLIENLPDDLKNSKTPLRIDLVLDGGIFNGSYLVGALYFLKEMEKRNYVIIERISGCSIGSVVAFLYFIDALDSMPQLYDIIKNEFKEKYRLPTIKELKTHLKNKIPDNICEKVNDKLYICYNNIKKGEKTIKSQYKNVDEIMNTIIKSCFIPYLIDGEMLYENKYIDGLNPYIFPAEPNKKILFLDLFGYDKIGNLLNVKNEKTNYHRILSGLLDRHNFYIKP